MNGSDLLQGVRPGRAPAPDPVDGPRRTVPRTGAQRPAGSPTPAGSPDPDARVVTTVRDVAAFAALALAVIAFSGGWDQGSLAVDGPGTRLWVEHALELWRQTGGIPYWIDAMWAGTPAWALTPSLPVLWLLPLAAVVGPASAVKIAALAAQVVGAWGCFVLVRSLWGGTAAPMVAGLVYGLSPLFVVHVGIFGLEPVAWVLAATPWFAWAVRRALEGAGRRYVVVAAATAAFAVLQQAEHAYGLALLGAAYVVVAALRERRRGGGSSSDGGAAVARRAAAVVGLALGLCAFWLLPFVALRDAFVFTPPDLVRFHLTEGLGAEFARSADAFVARAPPGVGELTGVEERLRTLGDHGFYLGLVPLAMTVVALILAPRHDRDGYLAATVAVSALAVWTSTAGVPLVRSELVSSGGVVALALVGAAGGLIIGSVAVRARTRAARAAIAAGGAALLAAAPFLTPFLVLRRVVPLLSSIRFPRLYVIAILGVAVAAAFPLAVARGWLARHRVPGRPIGMAAAALAVAGLLLADLHPYRAAYRVDVAVPGTSPLETVAGWLGDRDTVRRAGTQSFGQPLLVEALLASGRELAVGWPHPIAAKGIWPLTGRLEHAEPEHARRGQGVAGATHLVAEPAEMLAPGEFRVAGMRVAEVPDAPPPVRLYDRAVVVDDDTLAGDLAVALAPAGTAVVSGGSAAAERLGSLAAAAVTGPDPCPAPGTPGVRLPAAVDTAPAWVTGEVAAACAVQGWLALPHDPSPGAEQQRTVGGTVHALTGGLAGVALSLDRPPGPTRLTLQELRAGGNLGPVVREATTAGRDRYGLFRFDFEPVPDSAGRTYAFVLSCPECGPDSGPRIRTVAPVRTQGDLLVDGRRDADQVTISMPVYEGRVSARRRPAAVTAVRRPGPGRWVVETAAGRPALLVVAAAFFPGWSATVDGAPVEVLRADSGLVGLPLEAGTHQVRLGWHRPVAVPVGRVVTVLSLLAVVALLALPGRVRFARRRGTRTVSA